MHHLTYLQSMVIGLLQGVSEMFPVSSLGHSVLVPALIGGSWRQLATQQSQGESPYLAFIVGLHVATALALLCLFWKDWARIISGVLRSIATRRIDSPDAKLGWLIVIATIPAGITGLALEHTFRTIFAKPLAAAAFLTANGFILLAAERLGRRADAGRPALAAPWAGPRPVAGAGPLAARLGPLPEDDRAVVTRIGVVDAGIVGVFQVAALLAGISRGGITMGAGLLRGLNREQAIRFAFLLATPIILAAGLLKIPDLTGRLGNGIRPQVLAGSAVAFVAAFVAAAFLVRWFRTRTLTPFAVYCLLFGVACICYFR